MSIGTIKMLAPDTEISATVLPKGPPTGFGPLMHAPSGLETLAKGFLSEPYGAQGLFKADGITYIARVEPHPPAPERGLATWHKGVTVYEESPPAGQKPGFVLLYLGGTLALGYLAAKLIWR